MTKMLSKTIKESRQIFLVKLDSINNEERVRIEKLEKTIKLFKIKGSNNEVAVRTQPC
jgi:homoserine dehydrogenase